MTSHLLLWLWPAAFYLAGSLPTGYLMGRARGMDIRQHGSGNIGATNVGRVLGRSWGLAAFACDFIKGFAPLLLLRLDGLPRALDPELELLLVLCALAVILGHNYTPWLGFKGGKGVASSAGILAALLPWSLLVIFSLWFIVVGLTRTVSIGSLAAAAALPPSTLFFYPGRWIYFTFSLLIFGLVVWSHRSNIGRLRAGTESRLGPRLKKEAA